MTHAPARFRLLSVTLILAALGAASCNFPGLQATPDPFPTYAAQTVEARLTEAAGQTPLPSLPPAATVTPEPASPTPEPASPTVTNTPIPTETEVPCDRAAFIADVTIPDGTILSPGESFTKTWRLRNTGSCTWTSGYELLFKEGDAMGGPASKQLTTGTVAPGQTVDISVDLTAPNTEGSYKGFWWIRSSSGVIFGVGTSGDVPFYVEIKVAEPTPTPYPVLSSGKFDLKQTYSVDLDTGETAPSSGARDLWFRAVSASEKYLVPQNSAQVKHMGSSPPSLADCMSASLSTASISLDDISEGSWLCYITNQGNYGRLEIEDILSNGTQTLKIDHKTWDT